MKKPAVMTHPNEINFINYISYPGSFPATAKQYIF